MDRFARWTATHATSFWVVLILLATLLASIPVLGPLLFLGMCGTGAWWHMKVRGEQRPAAIAANSPTVQDGPAIPVVGTGHYGGWGNARGKDLVRLVREPGNPYDGNAVAVYYKHRQIGYLPRDRAAVVAPFLDRGGCAQLDAQAHFDPVQALVWLPPAASVGLGPQTAGLEPLEPWGRCANEVEVDYERDHRQEIAAVFHRIGVHISSDGTVARDLPALIVPSGSEEAPAVVVNGEWVGNVTGERCPQLPEAVCRLAQQNRALLVIANVWARNDQGTIRSNVRLRLPSMAEIEPPGHMPPGAHVLLPRGSKVQVTGEGHHLEHVSALLAGAVERPVVATLHAARVATARTTKEIIEVRVDDARVGQLTPHMSEQFLALVKACDEEGVTVACRARVKGNQLKADLELDSARAGDLSDEWIAEHVYGAGGPVS